MLYIVMANACHLCTMDLGNLAPYIGTGEAHSACVWTSSNVGDPYRRVSYNGRRGDLKHSHHNVADLQTNTQLLHYSTARNICSIFMKFPSDDSNQIQFKMRLNKTAIAKLFVNVMMSSKLCCKTCIINVFYCRRGY